MFIYIYTHNNQQNDSIGFESWTALQLVGCFLEPRVENDNAEIATAEEQSSGAERLAELSRARKEVQVTGKDAMLLGVPATQTMLWNVMTWYERPHVLQPQNYDGVLKPRGYLNVLDCVGAAQTEWVSKALFALVDIAMSSNTLTLSCLYPECISCFCLLLLFTPLLKEAKLFFAAGPIWRRQVEEANAAVEAERPQAGHQLISRWHGTGNGPKTFLSSKDDKDGHGSKMIKLNFEKQSRFQIFAQGFGRTFRCCLVKRHKTWKKKLPF